MGERDEDVVLEGEGAVQRVRQRVPRDGMRTLQGEAWEGLAGQRAKGQVLAAWVLQAGEGEQAMRNPVPHGPDGTRHWFNRRGNFHRDGGPAIEYPNGDKSWFWHGIMMYDEKDRTLPNGDIVTTCYMPTDDSMRKTGGPRFIEDMMKDNFWSPGYSRPRERT